MKTYFKSKTGSKEQKVFSAIKNTKMKLNNRKHEESRRYKQSTLNRHVAKWKMESARNSGLNELERVLSGIHIQEN